MSHSTIRTFRAPSVREALAQVRAAFGPDAVVLQAREVPASLFRKAEFEVMAALDDEQLPGAQVQGQASSAQGANAPDSLDAQDAQRPQASHRSAPVERQPQRSSVAHLAPPTPYAQPAPQHQASALSRQSRNPAPMAAARDSRNSNAPQMGRSGAESSRNGAGGETARNSGARAPASPPMSRSSQAYANATKSAGKSAGQPGSAEVQSNQDAGEGAPWFAQPAPLSHDDSEPAFTHEPGFSAPASSAISGGQRAGTRGNGYNEWQDEVRDLRGALEEARAMLSSFAAQGRAGADSLLAPAASEANAQLLAHGIDASQAAQLVRSALAQGINHEPHAILESVRTLLEGRLTADRAPWLRGGRHTLAFVGPTGVGKTTTLAKIAARALMEGNRRVGLITVDTYRIGASEQLARYGEIMGVPAFVAKNPRELVSAIERCSRCELILIDTAGRSGPDQLQRQIELVRAAPEVELHLVMSAASGSRDLAAIADRYSPVRPDRLLITKLDEAVAPGALLSATAGLGVPVSCVCNGQRVPEDIHALTRKDLVDLVLGSWNHERN